MIEIDKSAEADANAALIKLKQKELQADKLARKQFKGLFDKKPGEISELGNKSESQDPDDKSSSGESANRDSGTSLGSESLSSETEKLGLLGHEEEMVGLLGRIWPVGRRIFRALGLNKCTIL